ncbi:hypothetical protein D9615_009453 [Tricholomella constricta]|uniref:F-box domain-containing protein n=1 Tax=Tricholomella constricta TaxID=117010 RepID=A0A8H5GYR6_9AGAR|nr:hypothetical protein D9615_009453 [Tricholomella constricta]
MPRRTSHPTLSLFSRPTRIQAVRTAHERPFGPANGAISRRPPIYRLPPEILGQIFIACLPAENDGMYMNPDIYQAPMLLCQVCGHWRDIALSLPILWSTLKGSISRRTKSSHVDLFRLWLERARGHPLTLNLWSTSESDRVIDLFFARVHQWRRVTLDSQIADRLSKLPPGSAPLLEHVGLGRDPEFLRSNHKVAPALALLPRLRHLNLGDVVLSNFTHFTWPSLTHLTIGAPLDAHDCILTLYCCPRVEHVEFARYTYSRNDISHLPILTLRRLHTLIIHGQQEDPGQLLDHLTLPSLLSLDIPNPWDRTSLHYLDTRSRCQIQELTLREDNFTPEEDILYYLTLPCFHSLRSLDLWPLLSNTVATHLTWRPNQDPRTQCLPRLTALALRRCNTTDGVVSGLLASRFRPSHGSRPSRSLKWARVQYGRSPRHPPDARWSSYDYDVSVFRTLEAQGLQVSWDVPGSRR